MTGVQTCALPIFPFVRPYWHQEEFDLLLGRSPVPADAAAVLESALRGALAIEDDARVILTGSGRTALDLALRVLKARQPGRNEVVLPSYSCRGLYDPIVANGLRPVFVEVREDLETDLDDLSRAFGDNTLACLLVHLCGRRLDTAGVVALAILLGWGPAPFVGLAVWLAGSTVVRASQVWKEGLA